MSARRPIPLPGSRPAPSPPARTLEELEEDRERLEATVRALRGALRVVENVSSAFQRERILAAVTDALTRSLGAAAARVWLVGPGDSCGTCELADRCQNRKSCLHLVDHGGLGPLDRVLRRVPIGDFSVGRVAAQGGMITSDRLDQEPGLADPDWARIERLKSFAGYPLIHEGRLVGVVAMWSRERLRDEVLEALRILARHAATAIAGAQLIQDVRAESEKSQAATRQIEALVQASRSGILLVDRHSRVAFVNSAFRRLFALDDHELTGWPVAAVEASVKPVLREQPLRGEDRELEVHLPGEPKPRVLRAYSAKVAGIGGEPIGWMGVFDDVTRDREVDRMKTEFISTVSHELRTPLTSIKASMALLLDGETELDGETAELVQVSKRNADRLVRLVNDILDVSKIEAGRLQLDLQEHEVARLCAEAVAGIDGFAKKVGVVVRTSLAPGLPRLRADWDRVVQVLTNLLSNALKFSPSGSEVDLVVSSRDAGVLFAVRDRGPGIPADFRDKLFTKFAQSDRAKREQEGTGLGLAISRALVLAHGGEIWVESEPGHGASFFFTLPAAPG
ncbi:MAG: GAF domain-containing protein [Deltaproteobacteria bacterium]|nr:MAG: GAF domain-containing protein [Deltaproteobacteria bacterium]